MLTYWSSATPAIKQPARHRAAMHMPVRGSLGGGLCALMPHSPFRAQNADVSLPCYTGSSRSVYPVPVTIVFAVVSRRPQ